MVMNGNWEKNPNKIQIIIILTCMIDFGTYAYEYNTRIGMVQTKRVKRKIELSQKKEGKNWMSSDKLVALWEIEFYDFLKMNEMRLLKYRINRQSTHSSPTHAWINVFKFN